MVSVWIKKCFNSEIVNNPTERSHRFLEESLELVQSCGYNKNDATKMVDYVFSREKGEKSQEVGGVMVTLAALCNVQKINMNLAANIELERCYQKIDEIRKKQVSKNLKVKS